MTQFDVAAWKQFQNGQKTSLNPSANTGLNLGGSSVFGTSSSSSTSSLSQKGVDAGPAPAPPDYAALKAAGHSDALDSALSKAMSDYDALSASTQAIGFQGAANAGSQYSNRLMQQGINPIASGVVAAQAKLPIFKQLEEINKDKNAAQLDTQVKAASLAANIAQTVAQLQMQYSSTLADFNIKKAGLAQSQEQITNQNAFQQGQLGIQKGQLGVEQGKLQLGRDQLPYENALTAAKIGSLNAETNKTNRYFTGYSDSAGGRSYNFSAGPSTYIPVKSWMPQYGGGYF